MKTPVQITYRDIKHSSSVNEHIQEKAEKLSKFSDNIISCQVVIEMVSKHQHSGDLYNTRVNITVPGHEFISTHNHDENMYITIRDAFSDVMRQLEEHMRMLRGHVKHHAELIEGKVARLFEDGFGFIETANGNEYYFNEDSVVHPQFKRLKLGETVHFIEHLGDQGMRAHRVSANRRHAA